MYRLCRGKLTKQLHHQYRDTLVHENTPYAVFLPDPLKSFVFVTIYDSPLMSCDNVTCLDYNLFKCDLDHNIKFAVSMMFCYIYPLRYVEDLIDNCMDTRTSKFRIIDKSILHYADIESGFKATTKKWWLLSITLLFAVSWYLENLALG
ncbi:uncharacterized protein LOC111597619 [Drosophila hydei]|uniref:Uncharacterized protein LOC111597619 n=1 Tax=Drosophila hydei TaxID=7224 RepID=A0A6J1LN84_DROHY|nr:uncharacterized protein LOC111597619 [Drosophila hydei]